MQRAGLLSRLHHDHDIREHDQKAVPLKEGRGVPPARLEGPQHRSWSRADLVEKTRVAFRETAIGSGSSDDPRPSRRLQRGAVRCGIDADGPA